MYKRRKLSKEEIAEVIDRNANSQMRIIDFLEKNLNKVKVIAEDFHRARLYSKDIEEFCNRYNIDNGKHFDASLVFDYAKEKPLVFNVLVRAFERYRIELPKP